MGSRSQERREREREALREKILDAARDLFVTEDYDAVTMRRIADKIEYSPTAIYLHFKDKKALLTELVRLDFKALSAHLRRIAREKDPVERLRRMSQAYIEFGLAHPNHYRLLFLRPALPLSSEDKSKIDDDPQESAYVFLVESVTEAIAAGRLRPELKDASLVAQTLWAGAHGVVALILNHQMDEPWIHWSTPKDLTRLMVDVLFRGLTAP